MTAPRWRGEASSVSCTVRHSARFIATSPFVHDRRRPRSRCPLTRDAVERQEGGVPHVGESDEREGLPRRAEGARGGQSDGGAAVGPPVETARYGQRGQLPRLACERGVGSLAAS